MRFRAGLPGTKLTFLSWLSTTSGALHCQCFLLGDSHGYILHVYSAARWSILTSALALHDLNKNDTDLSQNTRQP